LVVVSEQSVEGAKAVLHALSQMSRSIRCCERRMQCREPVFVFAYVPKLLGAAGVSVGVRGISVEVALALSLA
jgi:hypothetical protein